MSRYRKDNSGGYGNPPISGQFQKGNKKGGRTTGSRSIDSAIRKVLNGNVTFKENGVPRTAGAVEALAMRALQHGLSGPYSANEKVRALAKTHGPQDDEAAVERVDLSLLTDEELDLYGYLACKATGQSLPPELKAVDIKALETSHFENTIDGIEYQWFQDRSTPARITKIASRAYWSAALPRRYGCDYDWPRADNGGSDADS